MLTTISGTNGVDNIVTNTVEPSDLRQPLTTMVEKAATGTAVDFTGIPSWVRRITVLFYNVSTTGADPVLIRLGNGTTFVSANYLGVVGVVSTAAGAAAGTFTSGFALDGANETAGTARSGRAVIERLSLTDNKWVYSFSGGYSGSGYAVTGGGIVSLDSMLDALRVTTSNGTQTFDAGTINVVYE